MSFVSISKFKSKDEIVQYAKRSLYRFRSTAVKSNAVCINSGSPASSCRRYVPCSAFAPASSQAAVAASGALHSATAKKDDVFCFSSNLKTIFFQKYHVSFSVTTQSVIISFARNNL